MGKSIETRNINDMIAAVERDRKAEMDRLDDIWFPICREFGANTAGRREYAASQGMTKEEVDDYVADLAEKHYKPTEDEFAQIRLDIQHGFDAERLSEFRDYYMQLGDTV